MRKLTFFITVYLFLNIRDDISVESTNVLFIIIDDLRPAIKSFGDGKAFTPNIDRLVNKSYYFTKAYSQVRMDLINSFFLNFFFFLNKLKITASSLWSKSKFSTNK